ncbi:hypothetical protein [Modestobacter marinus]|uniref:hypothetical protein n=1 Tax=Modestobacter marinus TaxID=477641 RepID=UPI00201B27B1|nr:hypothetical protein [Modestobacter marinus]
MATTSRAEGPLRWSAAPLSIRPAARRVAVIRTSLASAWLVLACYGSFALVPLGIGVATWFTE